MQLRPRPIYPGELSDESSFWEMRQQRFKRKLRKNTVKYEDLKRKDAKRKRLAYQEAKERRMHNYHEIPKFKEKNRLQSKRREKLQEQKDAIEAGSEEVRIMCLDKKKLLHIAKKILKKSCTKTNEKKSRVGIEIFNFCCWHHAI